MPNNYFIVTLASIIIIYQFHARDHTKFTTFKLSILHFLDAEDDSNYPACACAARGYVIGHGVYIYIDIVWTFFGTNLLSPKILTLIGLF